MTDFHFIDFAKLVLAFVLALLQPYANIAAHTSMVSIGDEIDGMILTTGAADARPLWVFCSSEVSGNMTTADCRVPQLEKLAIGHVLLGTDVAFGDAEWSDLQWELYLDDQYIDLQQFGTYDYLLPTMAPNPSLVREVFMKFRAWDVVLMNLQPGAHTLDGMVRADGEEYRWKAHLLIEETSQGSRNETSESIHSRCPQTGTWLSRFRGSCRLYG